MLITNITHYLNPHGNIAKDMPEEAREFATFLTMIIEASSDFDSEMGYNTGIKCHQTNCQGTILSRLIIEEGHEIFWWCPVCQNEGIIAEWEGSKWDRS